jgi:formylglycine-generating enzyme required for sulfatase activity
MKKIVIFAVVIFLEFWVGASCAQKNDSPGVPAPGTVFRDCPNCPEMVVIPQGSFSMGSEESRERPIHPVTIGYVFAAGKYEVTFEEWDTCVQDGGCNSYGPLDAGWGRGRFPVINVSWDDARGYASWLSKKTGKPYRLLSESEWEYVARAGATTTFWWGNDIGNGQGNCRGCVNGLAKDKTAPVGSYPPNKFGVHDTIGNVTEWVDDRWNANHDGAFADGSARVIGDPRRVVMRGGVMVQRRKVPAICFP